jgi:uncharacterized membrane protein
LKFSFWKGYALFFAMPVLEFASRRIFPSHSFSLVRNFQITLILLFLIHWKRKSLPQAPTQLEFFALASLSLIAFLLDQGASYLGLAISGTDFAVFQGVLDSLWSKHSGYSQLLDLDHFGVHQNWILILMAPLYHIWHSPFFLLTLGALLMWGPGLILKRMATNFGASETSASLAALAWWTASLTIQCLHGRFYPEFFYPIFILWLCYEALQKKRLWGILLSLVAFLAVKEDAVLYAFGLAVALIWQKDLRAGVCLLILSTLSYFLNQFYVKPWILAHQTRLFEPEYMFFWREWGKNMVAVAASVAQHPWKAFTTLLASKGWKTLYPQLLGIPLVSRNVFLMSAPALVLLGISSGPPSEYSHYYGLILWTLGLWAVLAIIPRQPRLATFVLVICPAFGGSQLEVKAFDLQSYQTLKTELNTVAETKQYCVQDGLWPYLENSSEPRWKQIQLHDSLTCDEFIFSKKVNQFYVEASFWSEPTQKIIQEQCLVKQTENLLILKTQGPCQDLILQAATRVNLESIPKK